MRICLLFELGLSTSPFSTAPSLIPCNFNNPKLNACIENSINTLLPSLRGKIANIDLPALEPVTAKSMAFTYKDMGSFSLKDFKGYGVSRAKVQNVKTEFKDDQVLFNANFFVPKVLLIGAYKGNVQFNRYKLDSKGQFNITLKGISGKLQVKGVTKNIDGEDYLNLYKFDILPVVKEVKFSITGIFPDPNLSEFLF